MTINALGSVWGIVGAVALIIGLLAVFIIALVLYRRTPTPKGCEDLQASEEKCGACTAKDCPFKQRLDKIKKNEEEEK